MRSITESGSRRRQSREKRKKSLPVRKLLELERANSEIKKEIRITCEKCSEKIPAPAFVEHLRVCETGGSTTGASSPLSPSPSKRDSSSEPPQDLSLNLSVSAPGNKDKAHAKGGERESTKGSGESSVLNAIEKMIEKSFDFRALKGSAAANASLGPSPPIGTRYVKICNNLSDSAHNSSFLIIMHEKVIAKVLHFIFLIVS